MPDDQQFISRWRACEPTLSAWLFARVHDHQWADDLLQETALAAWRHQDRYDGRGPFIAWVLGIARNKLRDHWRRQQDGSGPHRAQVVDPQALSALDAAAEDPALADELTLRREALDSCLQEVGSDQRQLLTWSLAQGQSMVQIAERIGRSVSAVKMRLHRLRLGVKRCIDDKLGMWRRGA